MHDGVTWMTETLWRNGLAVVPLAVVIWAVVRWGAKRPATRHTLWLAALAWLAVGILVPPAESRVVVDAGDAQSVSARNADRADQVAIDVSQAAELSPKSSNRAPDRAASDADEPAAVFHEGRASASAGFVPDEIEFGAQNPVAARESRNQNEPENPRPWDSRESRTKEPGVVSAVDVEKADAVIVPDPTPPTTVARTDPRAPSHLDETHGPVGRPSPFSTWELGRQPGGGHAANAEAVLTTRRSGEKRAQRATAFESGAGVMPSNNIAPVFPAIESSRWMVATWGAYWLRLRDDIGAIPPIPAWIWYGVVALIVAIRAVSCLKMQRRLKRAKPASRRVQSLVDACAASMGVRRAPRTLFVRDRVSPMLLCIPRPQLIIPRALWAELDRAGQRAVILHELAHLKRRDHWTHWFEMIVGVVYWWHPVIWWIRQRLRDEAENACDAWVTWFEPRQRRAYAVALLKAQRFLSNRPTTEPVAAIGVVSHRANRIARRLTMVMTHRSAPKASYVSIFALPLLFLLAWSAVPATTTACPPSADKATEEDAPPAPGQKFIRGRIASDADSFVVYVGDDGYKVCAEAAPGNVAGKCKFANCTIYVSPESECKKTMDGDGVIRIGSESPEIVVYPILEPRGVEIATGPARGAHHNETTVSMNGRTVYLDAGPQCTVLANGEAPDGNPHWLSVTAPVLTYESAPQARGVGKVYALAGADGHSHEYAHAPSPGPHGHGHDAEADRIARLEEQIARLSEQVAELAASRQAQNRMTPRVAITPPARIMPPTPPTPPMPPMPPAGLFSGVIPALGGGGIVVQKYTLPEGKLEALTKLMSRSDVPTRIRPLEDGIEVQATEADQRKFAFFVELISGDAMHHEVTYKLPKEKMADLTRLMERDDVPVLIYRGDGEITVQGNELVQRVFRDFLELLHPSGEAVSDASVWWLRSQAEGKAAQALKELTERNLVERRKAGRIVSESEIMKLRDEARALERRAAELEAQADKLSDKAAEAADRAESLKDRAERARNEKEARERQNALEAMLHDSKRLEAEAAAAYQQAMELEARAEALDDTAESLEETAEAVTEANAAR